MKPSTPQQQGFTLIEVLVASFILFLVISAITMVYRGSTLSSFKAERVVKASALVGPISEGIRIQVRKSETESEMTGQGEMGGISYTWTANQLAQGVAPRRYNIDSGEFEVGKKTFRLWQINLTLQLGSMTRFYQFEEVSW